MSTTKRISWITVAILATMLTTIISAQKSQSPEVLYRLAVQKEQVDGDTKAAIELYKQVLAAPGVTQKLKAHAQEGLAALAGTLAGSFTDRLICSDNCSRRQLSITADGRFMAYTENENDDLEIQDMVTRQVTRPIGAKGLTYAPWPLISPDGRQIVYASTERDSDGHVIKQSLRVVPNEASGKPRTLVDNPEFHDFIPGSWAHSNKDVLVALSKPDETWQLAWVSIADGTIKPIKSLGWRYTPLMGRPSLSPDGRYIAYSALADAPASRGRGNSPNQPASHIYVLAVDRTTPETEPVKGASLNEAPIWMPEGKSVLFISDRSGDFGLWSVALKDGREAGIPVLVKAGIGRNTAIGTTDSGSYYYRKTQATVAQFSIADVNSGNLHSIGSGMPETIIGTAPAWSPDGKSIAFLRPTKPANSVNTLFVYSTETGDERRYAPAISGLEAVIPSLWLHDGKAILQAMRDSKGDKALYRVDLRSGEFKQVAPFSSKLGHISSDDMTYLASPGGDRIVAINLSTGQQRDVSTVPGLDFMILSSDDKTIYAHAWILQEGQNSWNSSNPPPGRIIAVDIATGLQREVVTVQTPEKFSFPIALSPDGRTLGGVINVAGEEQLFRVRVDGSEYRKLEVARFKDSYDLSWSKDGASILVLATFQQEPDSGPVLARIPQNGGNAEIIQSVACCGTFSVGGSRIAVTASVNASPEVWALDNVSSFLKTTR